MYSEHKFWALSSRNFRFLIVLLLPLFWLHILTDGSQMDGYINAGAAIYCELFSCYMPLEQHSTAYEGETEAIRTALRLLNLHQEKFEKAVIFSDCTTISGINRNCDISRRQRLSGHNTTTSGQTQTALQWIAGRCQIAGNEHADALDKKDAKIIQTHYRNILPLYQATLKTDVSKSIQTWTTDKAIPKAMETRNSEHTRLAKKKGSCRIPIIRRARLLGNPPAPPRNPPRPLLHALQPSRTHGLEPSGTERRTG